MDISKHQKFITVTDYSVSKETFDLYRDAALDLLFTHPKPDATQLPKYYESDDYISHTDGKRSLFEKTYQFIKNRALKKKLGLINSFQLGKGKLLDIGAGTGDFLALAKSNGWQTTGIEPSEKARLIAEKKGVGFSESLAVLKDHSFDMITMWHVLEHVPDLENQIAELKRLLKPDGTIVIAVPNFNSYDANHYGKFWAAYDVPRHLWHFSKTAVKLLFEKQHISLERILPMHFDSFYVSLLSEKYKTGKMNFLNAFVIGWKSNLKARRNQEYSSHIYVLKNSKN
jgi:2-polyprenyl-3-methyl-5-hydroxy-6-metoxy-1,4-benzoquinol methylase